jgi:hypothetical protein
MSETRDNQCVRCGAAFLGGEPPHQLAVTDTLGARVELWCEDCIKQRERRIEAARRKSEQLTDNDPA